MAQSKKLLLLLLLPTLAPIVGGVEYSACDADSNAQTTDRLRLRKLQLTPENPQPGSRLCVQFSAMPAVTLREGSTVRASHTAFTLEQPLCRAKGISCPLVAGSNITGTVCDDVPLAAMLLAGQRLPIRLSMIDEAGGPVGCVDAAVFVDETLGSFDPDVEAAASESHARLRIALNDARSATTSAEARADSVRPWLRAAYEASPHWADAYARWRTAHASKPHPGRRQEEVTTGETDEPEDLIREAQSFMTFRENVMRAHHAGQAIALDARSDLPSETRRTLAHFA